ncbi:DUF5819 family protein [Streptomyces sp. FIT100]|uniref:DUF5819 family protein n=1 Tax=Streptomyces sp. FIT100 TaxID=2837956 RepID=UPI0021C6D7BE|nr:DUF5819 family protein [Streptomyces sp. FIT100]UUN27845.1 hypothetical protein KK483_16685 [Streptomyces sp. FIT100]
MTKTYRTTRRAALLIGGALLGAHMTAAALSQAPLSPAKLVYGDRVAEYLDPYFSQNWQLFAPTPISDDRGILARAACADGSVSEYYDVTAHGIDKAQNSRFFPSREVRLISAGLQNVTSSEEILRRLREKQTNDKKPVLPPLPYEKVTEAEAVKSLSRYSYDQMPTACDGKAVKVQVRMYVHELPPWSKRDDPSAEGRVLVKDFAWARTKDLR